jgi:hypothetical protein
MKNGIVTRGVLLDVPREMGKPYFFSLEALDAHLPGA